MAEEKKSKRETKEKENVHEIYNVMRDGKEKMIETNGVVEKRVVGKEEIEKENKLLRNILIGIGIVLSIVVLSIFIEIASSQFKYKGVKFNIDKNEIQGVTLYHTSFPVIYQGKNFSYNIYLRNDPRELDKKVPTSGTLGNIQDTVINITQEFDCNGDQVIAVANIVNMYNAIGKNIMRDENASCDSLGRYMYIVIQPGNETSIEEFGPGCYNINIKDCEILEGTERFIAGMLVRINVDLAK